jgi:hypothetical protein
MSNNVNVRTHSPRRRWNDKEKRRRCSSVQNSVFSVVFMNIYFCCLLAEVKNKMRENAEDNEKIPIGRGGMRLEPLLKARQGERETD